MVCQSRPPGQSRCGREEASCSYSITMPLMRLDGACPASPSPPSSNLHRPDMIRQHIRQLSWRQPAEPAIGTQSKVGQVLASRCDPFLETLHAVDGPEIDAR